MVVDIGPHRLILGNSSSFLATNPADVCIADPNYGDTSLPWDRHDTGWTALLNCRNLWVFGSLSSFMRTGAPEGWKYAQDLVWEKQNGTNSSADRFRRVHEHIVQFYRGDWASLYHSPVFTNDALRKTVRRKKRPPHWGELGQSVYTSEDGGPKLMRSVLYHKNCHGFAEHPTQKPVEIILPLVEYSCPPGGHVLDPFMGSGTTGVAAIQLGRRYTGIELRQDYFDIAVRRVTEAYNHNVADLF